MSNLLLNFKSKDSSYGVTRETLKVLAAEMDDGPLTAADIKRIRKVAQPMLPKGKVLSTRSLL
jgi:hypothetical protein